MTKKPTSLYQPRNWPFWLAIGLLWLLAKLPYRWAVALGKKLGHVAFWIGGKARRTAEVNLKLCFSQLNQSERQALLIKNFEAMGISVMETALAWFGTEAKLLPLLHLQGIEHINTALQHGHGVILCSAHFMALELAGRLLATQHAFAVIYRPQKNLTFDNIAKKYRQRIYRQIIARSDLRTMIRWLKNKGVVWYTPDIDAGIQNSIFVDFFGIPAATVTMTSRLAALSNAKVIPAFPFRRNDGTGYDICFYPAIADFPSNDLAQDTLKINQIIEQAIRQYPDQYLWQYKRFKTRPEGEKRFYD